VVQGRAGQGHAGSDPRQWSQDALTDDLLRAMGPLGADLQGLIDAVPSWTLWSLHDRPPMTGPHEHAQGRVALLGDAAHPLRPYLAQGAAMALEDAWTLRQLIDRHQHPVDWSSVFQRFARSRWQRNARVQAQSLRNGRIFHARGLVRWGRDTAMNLLGEKLMDNPWLYGGPPLPAE